MGGKRDIGLGPGVTEKSLPQLWPQSLPLQILSPASCPPFSPLLSHTVPEQTLPSFQVPSLAPQCPRRRSQPLSLAPRPCLVWPP